MLSSHQPLKGSNMNYDGSQHYGFNLGLATAAGNQPATQQHVAGNFYPYATFHGAGDLQVQHQMLAAKLATVPMQTAQLPAMAAVAGKSIIYSPQLQHQQLQQQHLHQQLQQQQLQQLQVHHQQQLQVHQQQQLQVHHPQQATLSMVQGQTMVGRANVFPVATAGGISVSMAQADQLCSPQTVVDVYGNLNQNMVTQPVLQVTQKVIPTCTASHSAAGYKNFAGWMAVPQQVDAAAVNINSAITGSGANTIGQQRATLPSIGQLWSHFQQKQQIATFIQPTQQAAAVQQPQAQQNICTGFQTLPILQNTPGTMQVSPGGLQVSPGGIQVSPGVLQVSTGNMQMSPVAQTFKNTLSPNQVAATSVNFSTVRQVHISSAVGGVVGGGMRNQVVMAPRGQMIMAQPVPALSAATFSVSCGVKALQPAMEKAVSSTATASTPGCLTLLSTGAAERPVSALQGCLTVSSCLPVPTATVDRYVASTQSCLAAPLTGVVPLMTVGLKPALCPAIKVSIASSGSEVRQAGSVGPGVAASSGVMTSAGTVVPASGNSTSSQVSMTTTTVTVTTSICSLPTTKATTVHTSSPVVTSISVLPQICSTSLCDHNHQASLQMSDHDAKEESGRCSMSPSTPSAAASTSLSGDCGSTGDHGKAEYGTIKVPYSWRRMVKNSEVLYFSPTNVCLSSWEEIRAYLCQNNTCKCGLECPLIVERTFNFDPAVEGRTWSMEDVSCSEDLTKLCTHKRKVLALATFQNSINSAAGQDSHRKGSDGPPAKCLKRDRGKMSDSSLLVSPLVVDSRLKTSITNAVNKHAAAHTHGVHGSALHSLVQHSAGQPALEAAPTADSKQEAVGVGGMTRAQFLAPAHGSMEPATVHFSPSPSSASPCVTPVAESQAAYQAPPSNKPELGVGRSHGYAVRMGMGMRVDPRHFVPGASMEEKPSYFMQQPQQQMQQGMHFVAPGHAGFGVQGPRMQPQYPMGFPPQHSTPHPHAQGYQHGGYPMCYLPQQGGSSHPHPPQQNLLHHPHHPMFQNVRMSAQPLWGGGPPHPNPHQQHLPPPGFSPEMGGGVFPGMYGQGEPVWLDAGKPKSKRPRSKKDKQKLNSIVDRTSPCVERGKAGMVGGGSHPTAPKCVIPSTLPLPPCSNSGFPPGASTPCSVSFLENPAVFVAQQAAIINNSLASCNIDLNSPTGIPSAQSLFSKPTEGVGSAPNIKVEPHSDGELPSPFARCDVECKTELFSDDFSVHNNMEVDKDSSEHKQCCGETVPEKVCVETGAANVVMCGERVQSKASRCGNLVTKVGMCSCAISGTPTNLNNNNKLIVGKTECDSGSRVGCCVSADSCSCVGLGPDCSQPQSSLPSKKKVSPKPKTRTKPLSSAAVGSINKLRGATNTACLQDCPSPVSFSQHTDFTQSQLANSGFSQSQHINTTFAQHVNSGFAQPVNSVFSQPQYVNTDFPQAQHVNVTFSQPQHVNTSFTQPTSVSFPQPQYMHANLLQAHAGTVPSASHNGSEPCQQLIGMASLQLPDMTQVLFGAPGNKSSLDLLQVLAQLSANPGSNSAALGMSGGNNGTAIGMMSGNVYGNLNSGNLCGTGIGGATVDFPASNLLTAAARGQLSQQVPQLTSLLLPAILQASGQDMSILASTSMQQQLQQLQQQQLQHQQLQNCLQADPMNSSANAELSAKTVAAMMAAGLVGVNPAGVASLSQLSAVPFQLVSNGNFMANGNMLGAGVISAGQLQNPTIVAPGVPALQNLPLNFLLPINQQMLGLGGDSMQGISVDLAGNLVTIGAALSANNLHKALNISPKSLTPAGSVESLDLSGNVLPVGAGHLGKALNVSPKSFNGDPAAAAASPTGGQTIARGSFSPQVSVSQTVVKATGSTIHHLPQPSIVSNSLNMGQHLVHSLQNQQPSMQQGFAQQMQNFHGQHQSLNQNFQQNFAHPGLQQNLQAQSLQQANLPQAVQSLFPSVANLASLGLNPGLAHHLAQNVVGGGDGGEALMFSNLLPPILAFNSMVLPTAAASNAHTLTQVIPASATTTTALLAQQQHQQQQQQATAQFLNALALPSLAAAAFTNPLLITSPLAAVPQSAMSTSHFSGKLASDEDKCQYEQVAGDKVVTEKPVELQDPTSCGDKHSHDQTVAADSQQQQQQQQQQLLLLQSAAGLPLMQVLSTNPALDKLGSTASGATQVFLPTSQPQPQHPLAGDLAQLSTVALTPLGIQQMWNSLNSLQLQQLQTLQLQQLVWQQLQGCIPHQVTLDPTVSQALTAQFFAQQQCSAAQPQQDLGGSFTVSDGTETQRDFEKEGYELGANEEEETSEAGVKGCHAETTDVTHRASAEQLPLAKSLSLPALSQPSAATESFQNGPTSISADNSQKVSSLSVAVDGPKIRMALRSAGPSHVVISQGPLPDARGASRRRAVKDGVDERCAASAAVSAL